MSIGSHGGDIHGNRSIKECRAVYQASSTPEIAKEVSQPKTQIIDIQTEASSNGSGCSKSECQKRQMKAGKWSGVSGKSRIRESEKAVEQINQKMSDSEAVFGIHEKTNRITIKIVDKKTKEVIREFPPEETLDMIAKAWELAGILVDEKR